MAVTEEVLAKHGLVAAVRSALADLEELPPYEAAPDDYQDWGHEGEFRVKIGKGECAGG